MSNFEVDISERVTKVETEVVHITKKVDNLDEMKENLKLLTYLQQKSDERDIRFEKIYEAQIKTNVEVTIALQSINTSMESLNNEIKENSCEVNKLKSCFNESENKSKIDLRDIIKNIFLKVIVPAGLVSGVIAGLYKISQLF